jgi:hypothetical protein
MKLPNKIGPYVVTPKGSVNKNRQYSGCEPDIVFDSSAETVKVNLKANGPEILLFIAGHLLQDSKLTDLATSLKANPNPKAKVPEKNHSKPKKE